MRKEDFFEVLGDLDDDIVKGAEEPMKRKITWKAWAAMAACLALVCAAVFYLIPPVDDVGSCVGDAAPMVYVNGTLYIQSGEQEGYPEKKDGFVYLGEIQSAVSESRTPSENFQANDPIVGCEVYEYGENIVVRINGAYWLYTRYQEPEVNWDELTEEERQMLDPTYKG